ncbi:MAG: Glu/Leu/Phe/Val dehydrogenase dimerization domain-containing protein [Hyphomicrobiales bacterium]
MIYNHPEFDRHHELHFHDDPTTGLKAIIAIHRAWDKPSMGGCRMRNYSNDESALRDVLRLSRGMSYKSVMAGLDFGGAKSVIIGAPKPAARGAVLASMANFLNRLGGRYITGIDVGVSADDVAFMSKHTKYTAGTGALPPEKMTAAGVYTALKASAKHRLRADSLNGLTISILGLGKVGFQLAEMALADGASVLGADINPATLNSAIELGVTPVSVDDAHKMPCDIFAPCALGGILNPMTIPELNCAIVAGAANNQFTNLDDAAELSGRNILYAPDYIANAGGLIVLAMEYNRQNEAWARAKVNALGDTLTMIFEQADAVDGNTGATAERIGAARIADMAQGSELAA